MTEKGRKMMGKGTLGLSQKAYYYKYSENVCSFVMQLKIELRGNLRRLDGLIRVLIRTLAI